MRSATQPQYRAGWIPVTERLPETGKHVLIAFSNFTVPITGRYEEDEEGGAFFSGDEDESLISKGLIVNAWMPLPEPYHEDKEVKPMSEEIKTEIKAGMLIAYQSVKEEMDTIKVELKRKGIEANKGFSVLEAFIDDNIQEIKGV